MNSFKEKGVIKVEKKHYERTRESFVSFSVNEVDNFANASFYINLNEDIQDNYKITRIDNLINITTIKQIY